MHDFYQSPLGSRYASKQMQAIFSETHKFRTWRRLWLALAEVEQELGLPITDEQLDELRTHLDDINYESAEAWEKRLRHDVMAHVKAYGELCPKAAPILHLGATSCYVGDNTDLILMREGLDHLLSGLRGVIANLARFAGEHKALPTLGFTHFQAAQPVTVGKRACLWLQDLLSDYEELEYRRNSLRLLGCKGTTGTQASFLTLFQGDGAKCRRLDLRIAEKFDFPGVYAVSGQTYSRKVDDRVLSALSGLAQSAHKFANDLRLLQHRKEMEEPFGKEQIGSSAMAYKRNPMRAERMTALARFVISLQQNTAQTASEQWLERTLDDSANKRLAVSEAFLATDGLLRVFQNITEGLVVYPKQMERHLREELPFMATETLLMEAVKRGGDRQELHERIRRHSMEAGRMVKEEGRPNDLLERLASDPELGMDAKALSGCLDPMLYVGRSVEQTEEFLDEVVKPFLAKHTKNDAEIFEDLSV